MGRGSLTCKDCNKFKGCMERDREYICTSFVHTTNRKNKTKTKVGIIMKTKVYETEQPYDCEDRMKPGDTVEVCNSEDDKYYNGDFGVIIDIKDDMYLVNFRNINATAWFNKYEIKSKE